jgi:hypothetical protein
VIVIVGPPATAGGTDPTQVYREFEANEV